MAGTAGVTRASTDFDFSQPVSSTTDHWQVGPWSASKALEVLNRGPVSTQQKQCQGETICEPGLRVLTIHVPAVLVWKSGYQHFNQSTK